MTAGRRFELRGTVQGVGFRPWVYRVARDTGIAGRVRNDGHGVLVEAFGDPARLDEFEQRLADGGPPAARVAAMASSALEPEDAASFVIVASDPARERQVSIPPDLATCERCASEIFDPGDRRYGYAFTNCTDCGPRLTIACDVPYDRAATTMAPFAMCRRCAAEYADPLDRRFHAQPNACPDCGPRLTWLDGAGVTLATGAPLQAAARALAAGEIVAIKGLGGFHLACDAGNDGAVRRLRQRKGRDEKPFAVQVADLEAALALAEIGSAERRLLLSTERPIVLLRRRANAPLAPAVAPGNPWVGLFLPCAPIQHLLLAAAARPLVMTSANRSDEPLASRNREAIKRLAGIADRFLVHDREIENRIDDSVVRVIADRPVVLRRARGYVPRPLHVARPFVRPLLATGAQLKNAFCLADGHTAWLGPHIGDLESLSACEAFEEAVPRFERFLGIRPEVVAHDLHPDYFTTQWALRSGLPTVAVQHHHAHVASAMAEHGLDGPVLGLAWDGVGFGTDGAAWGGELLLASRSAARRIATLRPLALAGGDRAVREVWRLALVALDDAYDGAPPLERLRLFDGIEERRIATVRRMVAGGLHSPPTHGVGRWFDAFGALVTTRTATCYEGQAALEWNALADPAERRAYPYGIDDARNCWQLDLRPSVRAAVDDLIGGRAPATISGRFHETLAAAAAELVRRALTRHGPLPVVLTGGCFQNALLTERIAAKLAPVVDVHLHGTVPPGDGGIALGQAIVADALLRAEPNQLSAAELAGEEPCV